MFYEYTFILTEGIAVMGSKLPSSRCIPHPIGVSVNGNPAVDW